MDQGDRLVFQLRLMTQRRLQKKIANVDDAKHRF
jgi:hypothetical protein